MAQNISKQIQRVKLSELTKAQFNEICLSKNFPVIFTDIDESLPSISLWSPEFLANILKNKIVRVNTSKNDIFTVDAKNGGREYPPVNLEFSKYIKKINENNSQEKLYMQQISILKELPELEKYLDIPVFISKKDIEEINLWVSKNDNISPLHYDLQNNFFIQTFGSKLLTLYRPWDFFNLYPHSSFSKAPHLSRILICDNIQETYPNFYKARPIEIIINQNEMLFLPAYWWHQVRSISNSVSVNIWWKAYFRQHFVPGSMQFLLNYTFNIMKKMLRKFNFQKS